MGGPLTGERTALLQVRWVTRPQKEAHTLPLSGSRSCDCEDARLSRRWSREASLLSAASVGQTSGGSGGFSQVPIAVILSPSSSEVILVGDLLPSPCFSRTHLGSTGKPCSVFWRVHLPQNTRLAFLAQSHPGTGSSAPVGC